MIRVLFITALLLGSTSCATRTIRSTSISRAALFPFGVYKHQVKLKILPSGTFEGKEISFSGVVQLHSDWIKIVVLSPLGTTLFRIEEDRKSEKVKIESYVDSLKKFESKFQDYYSTLKLLLIAPALASKQNQLRIISKNAQGLPDRIESIGLEFNPVFLFKKYDENGIPEEILVQHPKFIVDIKVAGYEL